MNTKQAVTEEEAFGLDIIRLSLTCLVVRKLVLGKHYWEYYWFSVLKRLLEMIPF